MTRRLIALGILALLCPAASADDSPAPLSENALHFRLDVGAQPGRIVSGWIDERKGTGTGYDTAYLDLDGDGTAETVEEFEPKTNPNTGQARPEAMIEIPHEGGTWVVDLRYSFFRIADGVAQPNFRWFVTQGDLYVWFINGKMKLYTDAAAAAEAEPTRLGPPFRFETGTTIRGRDALVRIGLKDVNGGTMRLARRKQVEVRPRLALYRGDEEAWSGTAAYG